MVSDEPAARNARREHVIAGGYRLIEAAGRPAVTLVGMGAVLPNVCEAASELASSGIAVDVVCLSSADLVFRALQARRGVGEGATRILDDIFPAERASPIVTVHDGHPHTLSFLSGIHSMPTTSLGVSDFGESGDIDDLYEHFGIDTDTIIGVAVDAVREARR